MSANGGFIVSVKDESAFRGKFLVLGFHGIGNIGHLSIRYIVESSLAQNKGRFLGYIISRYIPPFVEVLPNGGFGVPYEFYEIGNNAIFLLIRVQPNLEEQLLLAEELTEYAKRVGVKGIILIGGIDVEAFRDGTQPEIVYVANEGFQGIMKELGWSLRPAPNEILITGGVALFLIYAKHRGVPAMAIFAPTEKGVINMEAALKMAKKLVELLKLPVDLGPIEEKIKSSYIPLYRTMKEVEELEPVEMEEELEVERTKEEDFSLFT